MPTFPHQTFSRFSPSFALISVLALVSLAALTATAFLASARLERQATTSIGNSTRLDMALESGKVAASQVILENSQTDLGNTHIVTYWRGSGANDWTNELGYPFIGQIKTSGAGGQQNATWYYYPLFSPAGVTNFVTNFIQTAMRLTNFHQGSFSTDMQAYLSSTNGTNGFVATPGLNHPKCVQIPLLGGRTSPPVGWVYIHQEKRKLGSALTSTSPAVRIAWFTEDLEGLIDAERMGAATDRSTGTNSEEISLSSATGTNGALLSSVANFTNNRKSYISYGLLSSASNGWSDVTNARYFASGLRSWMNTNAAGATPNGAVAWIPVGIPISGSATDSRGYNNQGYTKLNLNNLVSGTPASAVANIAAVITNNLPNFTNRAGGMNGNTYVSNIAANIVDYVDTDGSPTATGSTVGYDNYPLPVVFSDRIALNGANPLTNTANLAAATITVTTYVQLWNCSTLTSPAVTYSLVNNFQDVLLRSNGSSFTNNQIFTNRPLTNPLVVPALPPNAVVILAVTNSTTVGPRAGIPGGLAVTTNTLTINHTNGNSYRNFADLFELSLGGKIISQHKGSYTRIGQNITNGSWDWEGTALLMSRNNNPNLAPIGDPRMLRFQSNPVAIPLAYRSSKSGSLRWGGYPYYEPQGGVWNGHPDNWPDGRTSTPAPASGTGQSGGAGGSLPVAVGTPITLPGTAPAILSTNGKFLTVTELGNIFDPMQWKPPATFTANSKYNNCSIDATWTTNGAELYGGGTTLRIGRPEHSRFAFTNMYGNSVPSIPNMGMSSAALLDLFATTNGTSVGDGPHSLGGGKINLNTAPAPVLRALAGGILLTNDPAQVPANYTIPPAMAEAFAQGVMRFRSKYPFLTPSHLSFIGTDPSWPNTTTWPANAVFGNTNKIALSTAPGNTFGASARVNVTAWNDQAAEEWFSKIYALSSCQSHNYRIYVVAQQVATNSSGQTNAIGPLVKKYFQIYMRNGSAVTGSQTNSTYTANPIYTWQPGGGGTIDIFKSTY